MAEEMELHNRSKNDSSVVQQHHTKSPLKLPGKYSSSFLSWPNVVFNVLCVDLFDDQVVDKRANISHSSPMAVVSPVKQTLIGGGRKQEPAKPFMLTSVDPSEAERRRMTTLMMETISSEADSHATSHFIGDKTRPM